MAALVLDIAKIKQEGLEVDFLRYTKDGYEAIRSDDRYRLKTYGLCAQRHEGYFMIRIRIPGGVIRADQIECIAGLAERFGHGSGHLTTRGNVELHSVRINDFFAISDELKAVGITTRSACGHTFRNILSCHQDGVCPDQPFDLYPWVQKIHQHVFSRAAHYNPRMPNRLNVSFSGCGRCAHDARVNDIGFVARTMVENGGMRHGFELWVAGSLGKAPHLSHQLRDFISFEEVIPALEAITELHFQGDMKNVVKGRLKFLVEKWGFEKFREEFEARFARFKQEAEPLPAAPAPLRWDCNAAPKLEVSGPAAPSPLHWDCNAAPKLEVPLPAAPSPMRFTRLVPSCHPGESRDPASLTKPNAQRKTLDPSPLALGLPGGSESGGFGAGCSRLRGNDTTLPAGEGIYPQRQTGFYRVAFWVPLGGISARQLKEIAELSRRFADGKSYHTTRQDFEFHWVRRENVRDLIEAMALVGFSPVHSESLVNVVACPGTSFCSLAITSSQGAAKVLMQSFGELAWENDPDLRGLRIHISGCPNSCAKHQIADIGFSGGLTEFGGIRRFGYQLYVGGMFNGTVREGLVIKKGIPDDLVLPCVESLVDLYKENKEASEPFSDFVGRLGGETLAKLLEERVRAKYPKPAEEPVPMTARVLDSAGRSVAGEILAGTVEEWERKGAGAGASGATAKIIPAFGREAAVFKTPAGFRACQNVCPHAGGSLGEGAVESGRVTCPLHGWQFDLETGECLTEPGNGIRIFPVKVQEGKVLLQEG